MVPAAIFKLLPALTAIPLLAFNVKPAVVPNVPPLKVILPAVATPGAVPKLASAAIFKVPTFTVVAPV